MAIDVTVLRVFTDPDGNSAIRSAWLTPARSNLPTGNAWQPN